MERRPPAATRSRRASAVARTRARVQSGDLTVASNPGEASNRNLTFLRRIPGRGTTDSDAAE